MGTIPQERVYVETRLAASPPSYLSRRDAHDVVLHFHDAPGKLAFHVRSYVFHRWNAIASGQPARIIKKNDVRVRVTQNHFQFRREPLLIALFADPSIVAGVKPEERRRSK